MRTVQRLWSRRELILAINLYCKLPFGRLHSRNPEIIQLANLIERTPGSVALKLVNFASLDPSLRARGIKGASNSSKLDREVWKEFYNNWDSLPYESEKLIAELAHSSVEKLNEINEMDLPKEGLERERVVKQRVNQKFFRKAIMASYNSKCCITGIQYAQLLVAGHIIPWSKDEKQRMNPQNGILINGLHDKAFENGLITITPDYKIKVSPILNKQLKDKTIQEFFLHFDSRPINLPSRFLPDPEFLSHHNINTFQK